MSVERTGPGRYRVSVDGQAHDVDAVRVGSYGLSILLDDASPISREIQVAPSNVRGELLVVLGGRTVSATVNGRRTGRGAADSGAHAHGEQAVVAPMPGRVVRVLVSPGDEVAARQRPRRRRSDEDGERAAIAESRAREGRGGDGRHLGRGRPRAGRDRISAG